MYKTKKLLTILLTAIFCMSIFVCLPFQVSAEEISGQMKGLDITFVVDVSGSMKSNDPNGTALEMVKAFVDTIHTGDIRVGFVAYNDKIVESVSPLSMSEQINRDVLKASIDGVAYSGNTDIGLGLSEAFKQMQTEEERNRIIVLISDGETDLKGSATGRNEEMSSQDVYDTIERCQEEDVLIYTAAFGKYDGSKELLRQIAEETGGETYTAGNPELLIEVMYGILDNNLSYKIQQYAAGNYANGSQEIRCILNDSYLDEINVLLISPKQLGNTEIIYGDNQIAVAAMSCYAVGKISQDYIDDAVNELIVHTETANRQQVLVYIIGYRNLEPVLNLDTDMSRNQSAAYQLYFKDSAGSIIVDNAFYQQFQWIETANKAYYPVEVKDGYLQGEVKFESSGTYHFAGELLDELGSYAFSTYIEVRNHAPSGSLPEWETTVLSKGITWNLDDYFTDADGDILHYTTSSDQAGGLVVDLNGNEITISAQKAGIQTFLLSVSDGEEEIAYTVSVKVVPLWQKFWWLILIAVSVIIFLIVWIITHRPKTEPASIKEIKSSNQFSGRLDLYFTMLPEGAEEIPPLVFGLYKLKESKVSLGELLIDYPQEVERLELDKIYLIADEDRKLIFYHMASNSIMIGNSIACRQMRYTVSFGDVIYIASADNEYDMELHYIAMNN